MTDPYDSHDSDDYDEADEQPDPQLDPTKSPGFDVDHGGLDDIEVSREDVDIGSAEPAELTAGDASPYDDTPVDVLVEALASGELKQRRRAAIALADRDPGQAATVALTKAARGDDDPEVRQFAVEALGKHESDRAEDVALAAVSDENPWVRSEAVVVLDRLDRERHESRLRAAVDDDHHAVRRNALISLFKLHGEDALDVLLAHADDESERVREWVAHMLGGVDDDRAREALADLATEDGSDIVRITAGQALERDPARFRRRFTGMSDRGVTYAGEDLLNRNPDL